METIVIGVKPKDKENLFLEVFLMGLESIEVEGCVKILVSEIVDPLDLEEVNSLARRSLSRRVLEKDFSVEILSIDFYGETLGVFFKGQDLKGLSLKGVIETGIATELPTTEEIKRRLSGQFLE